MNEADAALKRAWDLAVEDHTDEVEAGSNVCFPLITAGYAEADDSTWRFTPKGVSRADELGLD